MGLIVIFKWINKYLSNSILVSNVVNIDRYNLCKQKLFGVLGNFWRV